MRKTSNIKYKIVKKIKEGYCYGCKRDNNKLKKGSRAVSINGWTICLYCGMKKIMEEKEEYIRWINQIDLVVNELNSKYPKEMVVGRLGG